MLTEFRMPSLGPDMESGTLVEWRIKPGDKIKKGDVAALVETDKGVIDVEVFSSGVVQSLLVQPGSHVPVGTVLAHLSEGEGVEVAPPAQPPVAEPVGAAPLQLTHPPVEPSRAPVQGRQRVSPAARVKARELGIDLTQVQGSGPGGVITLDDVTRMGTAKQPVPVPARAAAARPPDMRRIIGKAMSRAKREIPHYYLSMSCNFLPASTWIERYNATASIEQRLLPSALFVRAVALAARAMPDFNGFYQDETFSPAGDVNVGMAIAMRGGRLVAPAILNADRKTLAAVMSELRDLATRVRAGHMRASELALSTITVTSLAEEGVDTVTPVIYPPQVAMVGFGSLVQRPWVVDDAVRPAPVLTITLAADHRVTDGRGGAKFLGYIRDCLQRPERL